LQSHADFKAIYRDMNHDLGQGIAKLKWVLDFILFIDLYSQTATVCSGSDAL